MSKDEEPARFESFEEAVAHLMADMDPGDWLELHHEDCPYDGRAEPCECEPARLVKQEAS